MRTERGRRRRRLIEPDLSRFHDAQSGGVFEGALAELCAGRKTGHWMWFIFPQLRGLGSSPTARHFGIAGLAEARAYAADPVLGERLERCAQALLALDGPGVTAEDVLGPVDALKLRSSATLFATATAAAGRRDVFSRLLDRFFAGVGDPLTLARLDAAA